MTLLFSPVRIGGPEPPRGWDEFVRDCAGGTIYHDSGWLGVIARSYDFRPFFLTLEDPRGELDGILPLFLVDSRTRPGQSGSPVIIYASGGMVAMENGDSAVFGGPVERLLGVYSGRVNDQSDLGFVWKVQVVIDIIAARARRPSFP